MKLKKIASLMLAGIMAVSMLAGCKSGTPDPKPNEGEEENTASGYSAMLGEKAADDLYKVDRDKIFTFADNADDQKALEKIIVNNIDQNDIDWFVKNVNFVTRDASNSNTTYKLMKAFTDEIKNNGQGIINGVSNANNDSLDSKRWAEVYTANGDLDMSVVMDKIYEDVKNDLTKAPKDGEVNNTTKTKVNYSYTVAVSVKNVPVTANTQLNGSVNFIAVTVTRTAEVA